MKEELFKLAVTCGADLMGVAPAAHANALGTGIVAARSGTVLRIETESGISKPAGFSVLTGNGFVPVPVELAAFDSPRAGVIEATIFNISGVDAFDTSSVSVLPGGLGKAYKIDVLAEESATGLRVYARAVVRGTWLIFR